MALGCEDPVWVRITAGVVRVMPSFGFIVINYFHLYFFTAGYETVGGGGQN